MIPYAKTSVIQRAISKLIQGKTLIIIAHRLSTITDADQILLVNQGKIRAAGTHEELILKEGIYKRFVSERKEAASWSVTKG